MGNTNAPSGRRSGASALMKALEAQGVRYVFGLCGHTNVAVLAAAEQSTIRFVGVHHEQMASHAADGYARVTGQPGVVLTHLGPGMTNALTGVANAALDSIPLVVITGNVQSYFAGRHAHMESTLHGDADQSESYAPFCKRIWRVQHVDALLPALSAAFRIATSEPAGPVLLDVSMDVFSAQLDDSVGYRVATPPTSAALDDELAARIAAALAAARRPVVYAGAGVARERVGAQLVALAEAINAPVAYELMAKGAVDDAHPLVVGMTGLWGTPAANAACREADVLLAVGASFGELDTSSWQDGTTFSIPATRLIHINADPVEIGRSYVAEIGAVASAASAIGAIGAHLTPVEGPRGLSTALREVRDEFRASVTAAQRSPSFPLHPARVVADTVSALRPDDILIGDTGWNKNGVAQQIPFDDRGRFIAPGGFATMGFGPMAALGTKIGRPEVASVALVGDGAFLANLSVIVTAVEEGLPVVWVVMNNGTFATISGMERRHFDTDYGAMFDASRLDYVTLAQAIGAEGLRVSAPDELGGAVAKAIAANVPYVIDVPCGLDHVPTTGHWDINALFAEGRSNNE